MSRAFHCGRADFLHRLRIGIAKGTFTMAELSKASGVDRSSIRGVLEGKDCLVSTLERIASSFDARVEVVSPIKR